MTPHAHVDARHDPHMLERPIRIRTANPRKCSKKSRQSLQSGSFRADLLQNRNVWVGILPEGQEIVVGSLRALRVACQSVSLAEPPARDGSDRVVDDNAAMAQNLLELSSCVRTFALRQVCQTAQIDRIQRAVETFMAC